MDKVEFWSAVGAAAVGLALGSYKTVKMLVLKTSIQVGDSRTLLDLPALSNKAVNNITINCPLRQAICKDMLRLDFNSTYYILSALDKSSASYDKMPKEAFCAFWEGVIEDIVTARREALQSSSLPSAAVKKYLEFKRCQERVDKEYVTTICDCDLLHSNGDKARVIVDFFGLTARTAFKAAQDMIKTLNGELNDATYCGHSCTDCTEEGTNEHCKAHKRAIRR